MFQGGGGVAITKKNVSYPIVARIGVKNDFVFSFLTARGCETNRSQQELTSVFVFLCFSCFSIGLCRSVNERARSPTAHAGMPATAADVGPAFGSVLGRQVWRQSMVSGVCDLYPSQPTRRLPVAAIGAPRLCGPKSRPPSDACHPRSSHRLTSTSRSQDEPSPKNVGGV